MNPLSTAVRWRTAALVPLLFGTPALAQRRQPPEFTQQGVLVANFWVVGKVTPSLTKNDMRYGRRVGDAVRDQLAHLVNKREARVIDGRDIRESLVQSSLNA